MVSTFGNESSTGPCVLDHALRVARGGVRDLVPGPVRPQRTIRHPGRGRRVVCGVGRSGRVRLMVPSEDQDAAMSAIKRSLLTAAVAALAGGANLLACPLCFGAEETPLIDGAKLG